MTAANFYNSQVVLNILANLSLIAACYWLVGRQRLLGVIIAMLLAAIVPLAASAIILVIGVRTLAHAPQTLEPHDAYAPYPFHRDGEPSPGLSRDTSTAF